MTVAPLNTFGTRAVWEWVAMIGAQSFTGEVRLATEPPVVLFAQRGEIYWAEQEGDPSLATRLVSVGALSQQQLDRGAVRMGDVVHLGRLFDRDPSIDRHVAEVSVELMRDDLLERLALTPTTATTVAPLRLHPTGVHRWFTTAHTATGSAATIAPPPEHVESAAVAEPVSPVVTAVAEPEATAVAPAAAPVAPAPAPAPVAPAPAPAAAPVAPAPAPVPTVQFDFDAAFAPLREVAVPRLAPAPTPAPRPVPQPVAEDPTPSHQVPVFTAAPIPLTTSQPSTSLTELWSIADSVIPNVDNKDGRHG